MVVDVSKLGSIATTPLTKSAGTGAADGSFSDILKGMVNDAVSSQKTAEALTVGAANGDSVSMSDVIQAVSKAELTLQTLVTVRDKAVEAYQQIMQMPV